MIDYINLNILLKSFMKKSYWTLEIHKQKNKIKMDNIFAIDMFDIS